MRIKALFGTLLIMLAVLAACGKKETGEEADGVSVAVQTTEARYESIPVTLEVPGTVEPRNRIALASQINGFVREIRVRTGDRVKTGQLLMTLDERDASNQKAAAESAVSEAEAALSEARRSYDAAVETQAASKASLELANQTFERYQKLFESRSVSPQEMDEIRVRRDASSAELASRESMVAAAEGRIKQVEARIAQAKAQLGRADVLVSYTRILAPASGTVVERYADAGSAVFPGSPLMLLETTGRAQVLASLPVEHAGKLHVGMQLALKSSDTGVPVECRVAEVVPRSEPTTHTVQFKVDLPGDANIIHGQYMKLEIPVGTRNALLVAKNDVRQEGQLKGIYIVEDGSRARFRLVKTAPYDDENLEILSGLKQGEQIITRPDNRIVDGIPVEIEQ